MRRNFRRRKFNRKRKSTYKIFFLIVVGMTLGFAAINTTLQLIGTLNISKTTWNIHWENPTKVGGVTATKDATLKTGDNTTVEYEVNLANQGDYYEFTVDAKNDGTIDAMITGIENKVYDNNVEITKPDFLDFTVTYGDGISIVNNHLLASTKKETYRVKVQYKTGLYADQLPTQTKTYKFTFKVTYMQANNAQPVRNTYNPGDVVYFDPVSNNQCDSTTFNLSDVINGTSTCYKWRTITVGDDESKTKITIQLDHNLINKEDWATTDDNSIGPDQALSSLATETALWSKVPLLNYTYDTTESSYNYGVLTCTNGSCEITGNNTPIATNVRARLITGEETKAIVEDSGSETTWTKASGFTGGWYYLSSGNQTIGDSTHIEKTKWLYENTSEEMTTGATDNLYDDSNNGYWILDPFSGYYDAAWLIEPAGTLGSDNIKRGYYGLRPVIEISKTYIN